MTGVEWLKLQSSHLTCISSHLFAPFLYVIISFSTPAAACACLSLQLSVFFSAHFIPCHSFVLSHHSQSLLLILAEPLYVNISVSFSAWSGRGQSCIKVVCFCCSCLHFLPSLLTWLFLLTHKKVHSSHFHKMEKENSSPNQSITHNRSPLLALRPLSLFFSAYFNSQANLQLGHAISQLPQTCLLTIPRVINERNKLLCQIAENCEVVSRFARRRWEQNGVPFRREMMTEIVATYSLEEEQQSNQNGKLHNPDHLPFAVTQNCSSAHRL